LTNVITLGNPRADERFGMALRGLSGMLRELGRVKPSFRIIQLEHMTWAACFVQAVEAMT
jgi:hypothetical protein